MRTRPLSPHLQIYRPQLTSVMSISHRLTGVVLAAGGMCLVAWLVMLATGGGWYATAQAFANHGIGRLVLFLFWLATAYHMGNGIRHLLWDFGAGLSLGGVYRGGWLVQIWLLLAMALGVKVLFLQANIDFAINISGITEVLFSFDVVGLIQVIRDWVSNLFTRGE